MISKLPSLIKFRTIFFLFFFYAFLNSTNTNAQCAGVDNDFEVCDITDPSSKTIDLFSQLGGIPTIGGIWKDDNLSGGLNTTTGYLNAQSIKNSGVYSYTYTVTGVSGCAINSAKITVTVGGYTGEALITSACSDDAAYNLFQAFNTVNFPSPHQNGVWSDDSGTNSLTANYFNANKAGVGTYAFTYTIPAIGTCIEQKSTVQVRVFPAANSGIPTDLLLCSSSNLNTNFDLNSLLIDEDAGGSWIDNYGTSELSSSADNFVNIENIYNNFGEGTYSFSYRVSPTNPICIVKSSSVNIIIEKQLDFTGASLNVSSDICENEIATAQYNAIITQGAQNIPNGSYNVKYSITGVSTVYSIVANFVNGVLSFSIDRSNFQQVGKYNVTITEIAKTTSLGACNNIGILNDEVNIFTTPNINNATLTIDPVCKGFDALVKFSGSSNLLDGDYKIKYNLSGANSISAQNVNVTIVGGTGFFPIAAGLIQNSGNTLISITNITNVATNCTNTSNITKNFIVKPAIDLSAMVVTVTDVCLGNDVQVNLKGLNSFSQITLDYDVTGANTIANQSVVFTVVDGAVTIVIPATSLATTGANTLHITKFTDVVTGCELILSNDTNFNVNEIPLLPTVMDEVSYCKDENKTVADLLPNGPSYKWFISATSTTALSNDVVLVSNNYYVSETSSSGCVSDRAVVEVTINDSNAPILLDERSGLFCGLDKPTLQDLDNNIDKSAIGVTTLVYFDALNGGSELSLLDPLEDKKTYYAFTFLSTTGCYSSNALAVEVSLYDCDAVKYDFFIPDGFSPNGDMVNDTFNIPNIDLIFPNFTLEIYNRYGNLMFSGNKSKPSWDGKNSDHSTIDGIAPNGVYFYVINFNKDNTKPKQGRLYLNR
ncbi:gliding motility-associated-like protein [Flavobacterium sp. 28A]|uniref:gliding motility-associated C-terminal domain-containing protein n=1 Tax=Flavobacterium sp. 28A TaxID=2735895 RepID=UPI00156ECB0E|nr:gliding motility-associated C-terminal domain-containing protein [Flavobacterium sp. 28A]NRT15779.1 gliding motility-associated-like protein [Flavobacterium sp. 28A]